MRSADGLQWPSDEVANMSGYYSWGARRYRRMETIMGVDRPIPLFGDPDPHFRGTD